MDRNSSSDFAIEISAAEDSQEARELAEHLRADVEAEFGAAARVPFVIVAKDKAAHVRGGVRGVSHWRWLYISHLWVEPRGRSQGLGAKLLAAAEAEALRRGCTGIYVDTFHPKAEAFYVRNGFRECGRISDFPPGHARIYLSKRLEPAR